MSSGSGHNHDDAITKMAMKAADKLVPEGKSIQEVISDPGALTAISQKLASVINNSMVQSSIPPEVRRRVNALKNLQKSSTKLEAEFYKEVQLLEAKYNKLYQSHYKKRAEVVRGSYQPTEEECHWSDDNDQENGDEEKEDQKEESSAESEGGIPEFWCTAFKNCELFSEFIRECDEEVLKNLVDVRILYASSDGLDFSIEFQFSHNEWFTNEVLTLSYQVKCEVDDADPWTFEGATIYACKGCTIHWNKGKDLTTRTVKKKAKGKGKGQAKQVTKQVPNETFFNMFSLNHNSKVDTVEDDEDLSASIMANYNLAEFIRDRLVPRAVLFFTGEAVDEDSDEEEGSYEEDYDEDDDEDYNPERDVNAVKPDCKQQ